MQPSPTGQPLPPAGWYPDPAGGPSPRWWDGQAWQAPGAQPANPYASAPTGYPQTAYPQTAYPQAPYPQPTSPQNGTAAKAGNGLALAAIGISAAYIALAALTHFVAFGILPVILAFRSRGKREPLAPVAIAAAVVSVVVAIFLLTRR